MNKILLKDATLVTENRIVRGDLLIENDRIAKIGGTINDSADIVLDCHELMVLPGLIDAHVHFREPGMEQKGTIYSESRAAVLGGVTTYFEMPNTNPPTTNKEALEQKRQIAAKNSLANYAFYLGASGDNLDEIKNADINSIAGIKVYMGSTTGSLLVDKEDALYKTFESAPCLIATHCEDSAIINKNLAKARETYGDDIPFALHGMIRSREACYKSSSIAVAMALETQKKLHIMHISTKDEVNLLSALKQDPKASTLISGEATIPHLFFSESQYVSLQGFLKCNPAVKTEADRRAIVRAVKNGLLSTIGTDHAPHELSAKIGPYTKVASGLPSVQYSLIALLDLWKRRELTLEELVRASSTNVAKLYQVKDRGLIKEGYIADLAIVNLTANHQVTNEDIASSCQWSPFSGYSFSSSVVHTIVSGNLVVQNGKIVSDTVGQAVLFDRG